MVAGWAADKYGPRVTIMVGALLLSLTLLLTSRVNTVWQLYIAYGFIGVGMSPTYISTMAVLSKWFTRHRGLAFGINSAGIGFGPLVMAPLAAYLIALGGWRFTFLVMASVSGFNIAIALLLKRIPQEKEEPPKGHANKPHIPQPAKKANKLEAEPIRVVIKKVMKTKVFWLLCAVFLMVGVGVQTVIAHIVAYGESQGLSPMTAATVLSVLSGASIIGRVAMGMSSDWIGRERALAICTFIEGIMILWLMGSSSTWMLLLFGAVFGFSYGGHAPQLPALVGETLGVANMGVILGIGIFFWGIGSAIGPFLTGYLLDITGSYGAGFMLGVVSMFLVTATSFFLKTPMKKKNIPNH
jgi:MFS family permease